jgi:hypothetical protein
MSISSEALLARDVLLILIYEQVDAVSQLGSAGFGHRRRFSFSIYGACLGGRIAARRACPHLGLAGLMSQTSDMTRICHFPSPDLRRRWRTLYEPFPAHHLFLESARIRLEQAFTT